MKLKLPQWMPLALCAVALLSLNPPTARAADGDPYFKNDDGRVTFMAYASAGGPPIGGSSGARNVPVKLGNKLALLNFFSFQIRGQLWDLIGYQVTTYEARYVPGYQLAIPLSTERMDFAAEPRSSDGLAYCIIKSIKRIDGAQQADVVQKGKALELTVSQDIFDQIFVSSFFNMKINFVDFDWGDPGDGGYHGSVVRGNPGVLGKACEWGWDVPGSPRWDEAFVKTGLNQYMNQTEATNFWHHLKTDKNIRVDADVSDLSISLGDFIVALGKANPAAAAKLKAALDGLPASALSDQRTTGLAALREAGKKVAAALTAGKPIPDDIRAEATQAIEQASTGDTQTKVMAGRLAAVVKLKSASPSGIDALLKRDFKVDDYKVKGIRQTTDLQVRRNSTSDDIEFRICSAILEYCGYQKEWYKLKSLKTIEGSKVTGIQDVGLYTLTFTFRDDSLGRQAGGPGYGFGLGDTLFFVIAASSESDNPRVYKWGDETVECFQNAIKELHPEDKSK